MKVFSVKIATREYLFTDRVTAEHFISKCRVTNKPFIVEQQVLQPSMIDDVAETLNNSLFI